MSKSSVFIGIAISFSAGILLASRWHVEPLFIFIVLGAAAAALGMASYFGLGRAALVALFAACAAAGALRLQASQAPNQYAGLFGQKLQLEGYIVEDPDIRASSQMLAFRPNGYSQRILITASKYEEYAYGDWAVVEGKVQEAENFDDFDYQKYLERFNVYAVEKYPKILVLKNHRGNRLVEWLYRIKHAFAGAISKKLPEPKASLLLGILIGARKTLPGDIVDNFNDTGVSHIIAISGYNISIIIAALNRLAWAVGRRWSFWLSLSVIAAFVVVTGASASVVRAGIMGFLLLASFNIGRQYAVGPALFCAGFVMVAINPKILFWDIGFQLSFAATLGIVYFMPPLEKLTQRSGSWLGTKGTVLVTMSAIVATLPLILLYFGRLSLVAPLVNLLVLPVIPLTMLLGFLAVLPWIGAGFAFAAQLFLAYVLEVTARFARLPHASMDVPVSAWTFVVLYVSVFALYWIVRMKASARGSEPEAVEAAAEL